MTVSSAISSVNTVGNGATTVFPFSFYVALQAYLVVQIVDNSVIPAVTTTLVPAQYSVSGIGNAAGGSVTYTPAIPSTKRIIISRVLPFTQPTALNNQDGFFPATVEAALDNLTYLTQQIQASFTNLLVSAQNVPLPTIGQVNYVLAANGLNSFQWLDPISLPISGLTGKMDKSANLSDVANVSTSRSNLGLGSAAQLAVATAANFWANVGTGALGIDQAWASAAPVTLAFAATWAPDFGTFFNGVMTLTGNITTVSAPANTKAGQTGVIGFVQDGTGSRTIASGGWNAAYRFPFGTKPTLSTAAGAVDYFSYYVPAVGVVVFSPLFGAA